MIGLSTGYHRAMVHISVSCNDHNIPIKSHLQPQHFHHNSLQYHNVIHNYSIHFLNLTIHNINSTYHSHSILNFSQKHTHNSVPISLSHYPRTTTITIQDNIIYVYVYKICHSPLYENNPVWKAPNSLFCIKIPF